MFSFLKKKYTTPNTAQGLPFITDIHSHILPGIDDGADTVDTSLNLIKGLINVGITQAIATPHIISDTYKNNADTIKNALVKVQTALTHQNINFKIKAAAEYMLDDYFFELLKNKTPLLTLADNIILTEFSYSEKPYNVEQMAFSIITEGYQPILAHPERYAYFHNDYKQYEKLADLGFLLQVNLLSLTGYYGKPVAKAAAHIVKLNLASFAATDLHHTRHLQALQLPQNVKLFNNAFPQKNINHSFLF